MRGKEEEGRGRGEEGEGTRGSRLDGLAITLDAAAGAAAVFAVGASAGRGGGT